MEENSRRDLARRGAFSRGKLATRPAAEYHGQADEEERDCAGESQSLRHDIHVKNAEISQRCGQREEPHPDRGRVLHQGGSKRAEK